MEVTYCYKEIRSNFCKNNMNIKLEVERLVYGVFLGNQWGNATPSKLCQAKSS